MRKSLTVILAIAFGLGIIGSAYAADGSHSGRKSHKPSRPRTDPAPSTPTPTSTPTPAPNSTPTTQPSTSPTLPYPNSAAMGLWTPASGTRYNGQPWADSCSQAEHDSFYVVAKDPGTGIIKKYPTWHPPTVRRADGSTCTFGHEHGRDPHSSLIWQQALDYFGVDLNSDGKIDEANDHAGIPFGYVNEQVDVFYGSTMMRHEDHVGHKVDYANSEPDISTDQFDANPTAGVVVPIKSPGGKTKWLNSGARCYHLAKVHQGVNSPDATMHNVHEVFYLADCKGPTAAYDMNIRTAVMMKFGAAGEFTNLCDPAGDRTTPVVIGKPSANMNYPGTRGDGGRSIIQRSCLEKYFLVPRSGPTFSMNMYEAWPGSIRIYNASGKSLLWGANLLFDVEDSSRYYWPNHIDANTGQANVGRSMDLCYENFNGRVARSGTCDYVTNYGARGSASASCKKADGSRCDNITWDDPESGFRGLHRGMYFQPPVIENAGGPTVLYTDPFGGNGKAAPFSGSVKQMISAKNVNHNMLGQTDPRINDKEHDDGGGTVHAPN